MKSKELQEYLKRIALKYLQFEVNGIKGIAEISEADNA